MKLETYLYEWNEHSKVFRIFEQSHCERSCAYLSEKDLVREILSQHQGCRRYVAADPGSYVRMVHAIAMKVFVHYKEDET